jgi:two-component system, LuxR family, sensor kinase FixL
MFSLSSRLTRPLGSPASLTPATVIAYLLLYLALDWVSFIHPMRGLNITPWNPQSALAVGLLLWRPAAWWLVWIAVAFGEAFLHSEPTTWAAALLLSAMLTAGYGAIAAALARWLGRPPRVVTRSHFFIFVLIVSAGALLSAALYVAALAALGMLPSDRVLAAVHRGWVGDAVGLLVTLPLLLVLGSRERRASTGAMLRSVEWWLIVLVAVGSTVAVFAQPTEEQFKFFYVLFLPVVWGAARFGVTGAVWSAALVQVLLIAAVQSGDYRPLTVFELQSLMAALAATGLLLGTTVDEREEAARNLRASLHLAAAGDMAAALAHELNQPLTAMSTYARASQLLAERLGQDNEKLAQPLVDVTGKLVQEASRAGEVVKRLRNFFRDRATDLQPTELPPLLDEVTRSQAARAQALQIRLDCFCDPLVPAVWLDRVQIAVVLRNLVANALEAASQASAQDAPASVAVRARLENNDVIVTVSDSGHGLDSDEVAWIFESRRSSKPGGMGVGLGISRSIVEAHGGRVWAEPGPGGKFCFSLPAGSPHSNE